MELYPEKLVILHQALDQFATGNWSDELLDYLPPSLEEAEAKADALLEEHLNMVLQEIGKEKYFDLAIEAASDAAKKLYLLRCFIASSQITAEPDSICIYSDNKAVRNALRSNSEEYEKEYEENEEVEEEVKQLENTGATECKELIQSALLANTEEDKASSKFTYDKDNPYGRALAFEQDPKSLIKCVQGRKKTVRDVLPEDMRIKSKGILAQYGIDVTNENAWKLLDDLSKKATIEERIIGRILYLIENSNAVIRDQKQLS